MKKNEAINIINQQNKTHDFTSGNTHFANLTDYHGIKGWWLNIPFKKFSEDIYLILHNHNEKKLILVRVDAHSINNPLVTFRNKDDQADIFIPIPQNKIYADKQSKGIGYQFKNIEEYSYKKSRRYTEEELMFLAKNVFKLYLDKYNKGESTRYSIIPSSNKEKIHNIAEKIDMSFGTGENYSERLFNIWNDLNGFDIQNGLRTYPKMLEKVGIEVFDKSQFVKNNLINISTFNEELEEKVSKSKKSSRLDRTKRLKNSAKKPSTTEVISKQFNRNPDVIVEVLDRAKGICERCKKPAPFIRAKDKTPYLEVHHIIMLANDGEDTVENAIAVCPNCHRELHFG